MPPDRGYARRVGRLLALTVVVCALGAAPASLAGPATVLPGFRSPSGNIKCLYLPGSPAFVYCSIAKAGYARKLVAYCAQPKIGVDWAGFTLGPKGKGSVECSGGVMYDPSTQHPRYVTLAYGNAWKHGVFTCSAAATGITCKNRSGHGLFVSRQSWRAF
jgi:hypothetical protein